MDFIERRHHLATTNQLILFGVNDANLKIIEGRFSATIIARGDTLLIRSAAEDADIIGKILKELVFVVNKTDVLTERDVTTVMDIMTSGSTPDITPEEIDTVVLYTKQDQIKAKTAGQLSYMKAVRNNDIVFAIGPAGTGKTYLAVAAAVAALQRHEVVKIVLARPAIEAGENLGFLPGDLRDKVDPYLRPLYDALDDMIPAEKLKSFLDKRTIEIAPLAYMRGRTLNNAFIILDEAQNATGMQMKMFLTRMGANSRAIITGDVTQIDLPPRSVSGLVQIQEILTSIEGVQFVYLDKSDVVRHRLVKDIINAYERYHAEEHV